MKTENRKVLDLGWGLSVPNGKDPERADISSAASLYNYDVIFYDPATMRNLWEKFIRPGPEGEYVLKAGKSEGLGEALPNLIETRYEEAEEFLRRGGRIFFKFVSPGREVRIEREGEDKIVDPYSWIPADNELSLTQVLEPIKRQGNSFEIVDEREPPAEYMSRFRENVNYVQACSKQVVEDKLSSNFEPVAETISGEVIGFRLESFDGNLFGLPPLRNVDKEAASGILLEAAGNITREGPEWAEDCELPPVEEIKKDLAELEERKAKIEEKIEAKRKKIKEKKNLGSILYLTDRYQLSGSVIDALDDLGLDIEETEDEFLDFKARGEYLTGVVEAEKEDPVGLEPYRRLLLGKDELDSREKKESRGLIIANGHARRPPAERDRQVTRRLRNRCSGKEIGILTTEELFDLLREKYSGREEDITEKLFGKIFPPAEED